MKNKIIAIFYGESVNFCYNINNEKYNYGGRRNNET